MRNARFWIVFVVTVAFIVIGMVLCVIKNYTYEKNLDALINRAQVAAEAEDMLGYTSQLQQNMKRLGVTNGYTAVIFKKPDNDMSLTYRAIQRVNERLKLIVVMPKNETSYQVALDDIRGTLREIQNPAAGLTWVRLGWIMTLGSIALVVATILAFWRSDYCY